MAYGQLPIKFNERILSEALISVINLANSNTDLVGQVGRSLPGHESYGVRTFLGWKMALVFIFLIWFILVDSRRYTSHNLLASVLNSKNMSLPTRVGLTSLSFTWPQHVVPFHFHIGTTPPPPNPRPPMALSLFLMLQIQVP